jgi:hypothetical protein
MSEPAHLSQLTLDELASGLPVDENDKQHVGACSDCRQRLEAALAARARSQAAFGYARTRARLTAADRPRGLRAWLPFLIPALAASLLFVVALRTGPQQGERLKGAPFVEFTREDGTVISQARVGEIVGLKVGGGGYSQALVLAVDEAGAVDELWAGQMTESVRLLPHFEVTPGSVVAHAFFSDQVLDAPGLKAALTAQVRARAGSPLEARAPPLEGGAVATRKLSVVP